MSELTRRAAPAYASPKSRGNRRDGKRAATRKALVFLLAVPAGNPALAQEKAFDLTVSEELVDSGLVRHLVPRFSMKTGVQITVTPEGGDAVLSPDADGGDPALAGEGTTYLIAVAPGQPHADRFRDWLLSDIGQRTIESFKKDGAPSYSGAVGMVKEAAAPSYDGNISKGAELSLLHCGRCHVIGEVNKHNGLGSTPSFGVLRGLPNWNRRFEAFYALNPHPAFTQVANVTPPFDPERPSPIHPLELTLEDLDEILAFVSSIPPADLGAPIQHQ